MINPPQFTTKLELREYLKCQLEMLTHERDECIIQEDAEWLDFCISVVQDGLDALEAQLTPIVPRETTGDANDSHPQGR